MPFTTHSHWFYLLVVLLTISFTGCGGGPAPVGVSGTVTLDGEPLPEGTISFEPVSQTAGQRRDAMIENGAFVLPAEEGVLPGMEFKVEIKSFRTTGRKYPNANAGASYDEVVQIIPAEYNTATTLRATISEDEQLNSFRFDLASIPR